MKILLITDQHFGVRNDNQVFIEKYQEFYSETVLPFIDKNKIEHVICLGDIFDKRKSINFLSLDAARKMWFDPLRDRGITMDTLIGNHDIYYKNTLKVNALDHLLGEYDNINVINNAQHLEYDGLKILMLPWICDDNKKEIDNIVENTDAPVCFGHLELSGFEAVPGRIMEHGEDPTRYEKFDLVCSGHYHMKSRIGNVNYLGNPYQLYWNDYGQKRGFHVLNTNNKKLTFYTNPHHIFNKLWYDDVSNDYTEIPDFTKLKGSYVKLIVLKRDNQLWFDRMVKALHNADVADLKIIEDISVELDEANESLESEDTMTILEKYVDDLEETVDKSSVVKILKTLYLEAIDL